MSRTGSALAVLLASVAVAQPPKAPTRLEHLGAVVRSQPHFYGAIAGPGPTVAVEWALSAPTVELGGTVRLTLTVRNAVNPRELTRPDLAKIAEFTEKFSRIEPEFGDEPAEDSKAVEFVYVLRPRNEGKFEFSLPQYAYYKPGARPGLELQTRRADPLPLTVTKPVVKVLPPVPLSGPESFFAPAGGSYSASGSVPRAYWLALLVVPPVLLVVWVLAWRWLYPDAARLARLRRNRAVRRTLNRLRAAHRAADPAGEIATAFRYYLSARFGLHSTANTPGEVATGLRELKVEEEHIREASELLRRCDGERFGSLAGGSVADDAVRLVLSWEGGDP